MSNVNFNFTEGFTHGGVFHADDVFSAALLRILNPNIKIARGFKVPDDYTGIVFDVGGGEFDHHAEPRATRENGVPYAAFGKLWAVYGPQLVGEAEAKQLDESFIQPLDATDNGGATNPLSIAISAMNPLWDAPQETQDVCFASAVELAMGILRRMLQSAKSRNAAAEVADAAIVQDGQIAVLDSFAPVMNRLVGSGKAFLVFPSNRGGWNAQVVPVAVNSREPVLPFPKEWWGASKENLPDGVTFCHASGFLLAAGTREAAIAACKEAIKRNA